MKLFKRSLMSDVFSKNMKKRIGIITEQDLIGLTKEERVTKMIKLAKEKTRYFPKKEEEELFRIHDYD